MDLVKIQTLIAQGKVITDITDIDPTQTFLQVGIYQPNNRKIKSGNADTYPSFVIPLSEIDILPGPQGPQGIQGPQGPQGIQGVQGPAGLPGLFAQTALSIPVTYATGEQSLTGTGVGGLFVPANGFQVGDSFMVKLCGPITCANNQDLRVKIKANGITLIDTGVFQMPQTTSKIFELSIDFTITKIGIAGVAEIFANGLFTYNKDASNAIEGVNVGAINNTTFNTTIANTLSITAEWIGTNAINTIRSQNFTLTKTY